MAALHENPRKLAKRNLSTAGTLLTEATAALDEKFGDGFAAANTGLLGAHLTAISQVYLSEAIRRLADVSE